MTAAPGPDERRVAYLLRRIVDHDAARTAPAADPTKAPRLPVPAPNAPPAKDWWDDLYTEDATDTLPTVPQKPPAAPAHPNTAEIRASAAQIVTTVVADPDQRRRVRHVVYNSTAAGAGWWFGAGPWMHTSLLYYGAADTTNGVYVGAGVIAICLIAEMRSHRWRQPGRHIVWRLLGWAARIPLATAVLALALYGPDALL